MDANPFGKPPYLDWSLDRWKIATIFVLFVALVAMIAWGPEWKVDSAEDNQPANTYSAPTTPPVTPSRTAAVSQTETTGSPSLQTAEASDAAAIAPTEMPAAPDTDAGETVEPAQDEVGAGTPSADAGSASVIALPLTLSSVGPNAVVPRASIEVLRGTGPVDGQIEVRVQHGDSVGNPAEQEVDAGQTVGNTQIGGNGLWSIEPTSPLSLGQNLLSVRLSDGTGVLEEVLSPIVVTVLADGEEGPLSLSTPTIAFPSVGARLRNGPVTFTGNGLPGMRVRLYVDSRQVGETMVNTQEKWELTLVDGMGTGAHIARAGAIDPQGEIVAESPPVALAVYDAPLGSGHVPRGPTPLLPLQLFSMAYGDRQGTALVLGGLATPHSSVAAWLLGEPLRFANARSDGRWQIGLLSRDWRVFHPNLEIRTNLEEVLSPQRGPDEIRADATAFGPVVVRPQPGTVLTTRRPVITGMAQPGTEVSVLVNRVVVARVLTDRQGQWAVQLTEPLSSGPVSLTAFVEVVDDLDPMETRPVVVTVAPQL